MSSDEKLRKEFNDKQRRDKEDAENQRTLVNQNPVMGLLMLLMMGASNAQSTDKQKRKESEKSLSLFDQLFPVVYAKADEETKKQLDEIKVKRDDPSYMAHFADFSKRNEGTPLYLDRPLQSHLNDTYKVRNAKIGRLHTGVDERAAIGTDLKSKNEAYVAHVGYQVNKDTGKGYGKFIVLYHGNGVYTMDAHLNNTLAKEGSYVPKGHLYAETGDSGSKGVPHLHHEVWIQKNGKMYTVDPIAAEGKNLADPKVQEELIKNSSRIAATVGKTSESKVAWRLDPKIVSELTGQGEQGHNHGDHGPTHTGKAPVKPVSG